MSRTGCYNFSDLERSIPHKGVFYTFMTEDEAIDAINAKVRKICKAKNKALVSVSTFSPKKILFGLIRIKYTYYYS